MCEPAIANRTRDILASLPEGVLLVGAAKTRSADEAREAIEAGLPAVGHNYVQEAAAMRQALSGVESDAVRQVRWHLIGHLQRNKARKAVALFDMIETVDSVRLANAIDRHCAELDKIMPVLIEINSGKEPSKTGVLPDQAEQMLAEIAALPNIRVQGLMTMGPRFGNPDDAKPYFRLTKALFDKLSSANLPDVEMRYLSMGMSNTYQIAIKEGANVVRIGTRLFGERAGGQCKMR